MLSISSTTSFSRMKTRMKMTKVIKGRYKLCFIYLRLKVMIQINLWRKLNRS